MRTLVSEKSRSRRGRLATDTRVTALNPGVVTWWQRFGFDPFDAENATNLDLHLRPNDITATLARP
jgi:hypothetical protein